MAETMKAQFGLPQEWDHFAESHRLFLERFSNLQMALETAFNRQGPLPELVDKIVFFIGRLCAEDFMEILLLCGNGYGIGAMKILRGMYEQAVTARYLHGEPAEADAFWNFHLVSQYKLAQAIKETFGEGVLPQEKIEELRVSRDKVKEQFWVTICKACGAKGLNYRWSKLDVISMARKTGSLGKRIVQGYYIPISQAHSTVASILSRLKQNRDAGVQFDEGPQREQADRALMTAHSLLLNVLDLQRDHFRLDGLDKPLELCFQDFVDIWKQGGENQAEDV